MMLKNIKEANCPACKIIGKSHLLKYSLSVETYTIHSLQCQDCKKDFVVDVANHAR